MSAWARETGQAALGTRRKVNSLEGNLIVEVKFQ